MKKIIILVAMLIFLTGCGRNIKNGATLLEEGKYEEAISTFQKDIKRKKNLDQAYRGVAIAYFELGNYKEALQAFELALDNQTTETATLCSMMAVCYIETEEYNLAIDWYEKALSKDDISKEQEQEIQYNLIAIYEKMENWEAAKTQMEKYIELYPDDSRVKKEADFLKTR